MTSIHRSALILLLAAGPAFAEAPKQPAKDLGVHSAKVPGLELRFVDYHWQPDIMIAMAKGATDVAAARRDWIIARVAVLDKPLTIEGTALPQGNYAFSLFPAEGDKGMAIEFRKVDMRDLPNLNVMMQTPAGTTVYRGPAKFEMLDPIAPRMGITLKEEAGAILLTMTYGDRKLPLKLTR